MQRQLEMFPELKCEEFEKRFEKLEEKNDNLRKGLHAKISRANQIALEAKQEVDFLKSMICKNNPMIWSL